MWLAAPGKPSSSLETIWDLHLLRVGSCKLSLCSHTTLHWAVSRLLWPLWQGPSSLGHVQ